MVVEGLWKLEAWAVAMRLNLNDLEWVVVARFCELAMEAIFCKKVVLNMAVLEREAAARHYGLAIAARLCELDAWAAAGLRLGGCGQMVARLGLFSFQLVVVIVQAEAVLEVEAGGVAQSEAGVACRCWKTNCRCLS